MIDPMERLAARVANDPFFLAFAFATFQRGSKMDDRALCEKLGCDLAALARLRLCRMPAEAAPAFWQDVTRIANHFAIDADELAGIVRLAQGIVRLQAPAEAKDEGVGYLMAARDDEPPDPGDDE